MSAQRNETLRSFYSSTEALLSASPYDIAPVLLHLAWAHRGSGGIFWPEGVTRETTVTGEGESYPWHQKAAIETRIQEGWDCLRKDSLITSAPGENGRNGYMIFTTGGEKAAASPEAFERLRAARAFPKALLHPSIADKVWPELMRGELDDAVFHSFKAVEEAVRVAGKYTDADYGVDLMRKAFHLETCWKPSSDTIS